MSDNHSIQDGPQALPPVVQPADRALESAIITGWNDTHHAYPLDECLQQLIEQQVERSPDSVAVCCDDQSLSFRQLNSRANRLAHYLRELGVGPDSLVGVQMERSVELMIALLGILKAGGAYLPLDPDYPLERLALLLEDAAVGVVLTQRHLEHRLKTHDLQVLCLDDPASQALHADDSNPSLINSPGDLAYVIYTSGSTGRPKGCMLPHKAICNRLLWMQRHYAVGPAERILQKTPFTFDVSVWELFLPLLSGACLVMARPQGHKDADYLVDIIKAQRITICHFVPSMLRFFLKHPGVGECRSLSKVFVSGEALTHDLLLQYRSLLDAPLHNLYGPTEAAVDVTWWHAEPREDRRVPIGRPIDNIRIHILDAGVRPVAIGQTGELCIGGVGLARGYLNRPELTAEKFIRDPFCTDPEARLYRTGDEARFLDDGQIEVLGRFDSQVKLRGFRIELGEIEHTLATHPSISDAVVLVQDPGSQDPKLVAYVVAQGLDSKAVRDFVKARLPEYMTPNRVQFVEQIPVTSHGKADRQALLAGTQPAAGSTPAPDRQTVGAWLQGYFIEALGLDQLALDEDLFDQGATSFTLVQAIHSIQQQYQVTLPVERLLEQPTIAAIIAFILERQGVVIERTSELASPQAVAASAQEPLRLETVCFDSGAYLRTAQVPPASLERLCSLLSLLREVALEGQGKYLYSSAGGLNAIQFYLYVGQGRVAGLPEGAWYYHPRLNRLLPTAVPASLEPPCAGLADVDIALFMVAEMAAIEPIYNQAAPALLVLEAGYIEQLLLSRQAGLGIALAPTQGLDAAAVCRLFQLQPSHRVLHCLVQGACASIANGSPVAAFADFLSASNNGFDLPGKAALEQLHQQQRQIRRDLPEQGEHVIGLPSVAISAEALRLRATQRQYGDAPPNAAQLSRLLSLLRTAQDGACLYHADAALALKVYVQLVAAPPSRDQEPAPDLPGGLYRYHSASHSLQPMGEVDLPAFNSSYTPFNRKHAQQSRLRIFIIGGRSAAHGAESRYFGLLQAGRIGQLLLEKQAEFGIGLCPIGSMYFDKIRGVFALEDGDELLHSFVGGTVAQPLAPGWPRLERESAGKREPDDLLAIVGISGRYPGAASAQQLWHNLSTGHSSIATVSRDALLYGQQTQEGAPHWSIGALADKQLFDPLLFKITPAEAKTLDPQERLFLQAVWHCLESSGHTAASLRRQAGRVGVFVGAMWGDYQHHQADAQGAHASSFHSAIANRVSFFNDFNGPSVAFDTSCSSGLTALHFACASIRQGECQAAIVGGVNLISHPSHLELLSSLQLLSAEGQAHPFGLDANGWVAGEGVGALLIRPVADARRDGDQILGLIRTTAIGHSGKTLRYGAPSAETQAASMRQALQQAGLAPEDIGYVEAAAPGASLADGAEFAAIAKVFGDRQADAPLPVGSIKANIGHLESASALSQITKVLMQLQHRQIAPTLGCHPLSPLIAPAQGNLVIADSLSPWQGPQRALINAFGASGSAGHLILEAAPASVARPQSVGPWLFVFSAASRAQLDQWVAAFASDLQAGRLGDASLGDISFTLCTGRVALGHRLALVAASAVQLQTLLNPQASESARRGSGVQEAPARTVEEDLRGLDHQALDAIGQRWVLGETDLQQIARHDARRVALAPYLFAGIDCHIAAPVRPAATRTPAADEGLQAALESYLGQLLAQVSAIPESSLDRLETFDRYGLTSLMITALNQRLAQAFGALPSTLLFEHQSLSALASWFASEHPLRSRQLLGVQPPAGAAAQAASAEPFDGPGRYAYPPGEAIAIIGLAGRFPGAADVDRFWDNLKHGVDSISEIPGERWQNHAYYSRDRSLKGKINTQWGGFIDDVDRFDPLFFNISPRDAERMDPQERIFLETAWHTLEDAGYDRASLQRHYQGKMGVFVGVMHGEYLLYTRSAAADCTDDAVDASFGSIANRVSYVFDCNGPSMAIDTICSSSLTALHLAVESLKRGECQVALAGGVNLSLHPNKYFIQSQLTMSSTDGRCRSFGEGGDGFVPGEGVGAVLLKPLSRARADGDNIHGVIRATSINHNGKTHGYTVPSPNAQGAMIAESLAKAGMDPRELSYIEAHGTGTALGDPIEISGLQQAFAKRSAQLGSTPALAQRCALGSAKSNIGHLESAAGIAGVAKVLLQLKHRQLVPSLHSSRLNPAIRFDESPFHIPQHLQEWRRPLLDLDGSEREYPLAACVSSFGSGGSNGHVIIAQDQAPERAPAVPGQSVIIVLSARTAAQLHQQVERLQRFLQRCALEDRLPRLDDLAFTLQQGREALEYRLAFTADGTDQVHERLAQVLVQLSRTPECSGCFDPLYLGRAQENKAAMAVLAHDEDMAATLAAWAGKGKYRKLLELWVKGLAVDWAALGACGASARRISLPGYPFARERTWVAGDFHFPPLAQTLGEGHLHPLLQRNVSDLSQQKFSSVFSGNEFFLRDHRVHQQRVLPGVAYLEMAREAISRSLGDQAGDARLVLCNLVWAQPVVIGAQDTEPATVDIHIKSLDGQRLGFEVRQPQRQALCCQGEAQLLQGALEPVATLAALQAGIQGHYLDADTLYGLFDSVGIDYGPSHRPVRQLLIADGQLLAQIELPPSLSASHLQFVLHPSLMDGALQSTVGLLIADQLDQGAPARLSHTWVPFALARLQQGPAPLGQRIWAWVRPASQGMEAGQACFDIDIYNQQGEHCVALESLALREMKAASPRQAMLADPAQADCYLVERWQRLSLLPQAPGNPRLLLIANDVQGQQQLAARYPHAASLLLDGTESIETLTALLGEVGPLEHLVWLAPAGAPGPAGMIQAQQVGVLGLLRLIKALLALALDQQPLAWTVITRATLTVFGQASSLYQATYEPVAPAHASIHGLVGVMAKEYSHWPVRLLDLPAGDGWPEQDLLALPVEPHGNALAWRDQAWYRAYLAPCLAPVAGEGQSLYRDAGVYLVVGGAGGIGRLWSEHLIRTHGAQVIWLGRREQDSRIDAAIAELAQLGPAPRYISADAGNHAALHQAVTQVLAEHGRIHGVIHAAIQLEDRSLARMDPQAFAAVLAAKVDVCVCLAEVFEHQPLDFMLFFSSLQSFTKSAGQGNYAAGCTFKNAFGRYLGQQRSYPVKVINWGYWGEVGAVACADYRRRMASVGLGSIEAEQAMHALQVLLGAGDGGEPLSQITFLRTSQRLSDAFGHLALPAHPGGPLGEYGEIRPPAYPSLIERIQANVQPDSRPVREAAGRVQAHKVAIEALQTRLLQAQLRHMDCLDVSSGNQLLPMYQRWLAKSLEELAQRGCGPLESEPGGATGSPPATLDALWQEWDRHQPAWLEHASLRAETRLAEATLRVLPQILQGQVAATDVLFPNASMSLVEGIYKDNPVSDFFNEVLLDALLECVRGRLEQAPQTPIRILEVGAGTGGTSARAFEKLRPFQAHIAEYCYTDVSQAFLMHAQQAYGPHTPYLAYQLFDVDKPLAAQGIEPGAYDLVIATNVLHATQDLGRTLKNVKAALKHNGLVLINEITGNGLFTHLTFGLLKGWWLFDDPQLRLPGGPALAPRQWKQVLESEGYRQVHFPALAEHDLGQQVVIARSNGLVWQDRDDTPVAASGMPLGRLKSVPQAPPTQVARVLAAPAGEVGAAPLKAATVTYLKQVIGGLFKIAPEQIDAREALETYGIDSILVVQLTNLLRDKLAAINSTLFFEYQTVEALAEHFVSTQPDRLKTLLGFDQVVPVPSPSPSAASAARGEPSMPSRLASRLPAEPLTKNPAKEPVKTPATDVAIVGLAGRYANSDNVRQLWQHLKQGRHCITQVPADRWDWRQYFDQAPGTAGRIYTPWGGFIREIDKFDPLFFHLSPREAMKMDPQERLFLEEAHHCISDAGYTPARLAARHRVGVFVGVMNGTYSQQSSYWSVANRVSYQFNFQGPSLAVDTACSSSITALHLALESLHSNSSDCALVGGVSLLVDPVHYMGLSEMKMLSSGPQCKAFGAEADGFVAGEGVGALLLKPLARAEADGDRIYGVIKGSMINAGGKTNGYTVPNPLAQSRLVVDSLARAGVDARAVSYVEAHGTGTALGDPIEIAGLARAFNTGAPTPLKQCCALGSIKANIGHCESAAGIAGITKVLLQLQHQQLVPSLHAQIPNPQIDFANSPFVVQQALADWPRPQVQVGGVLQDAPRIATVSSFGAGGANAHVVIEEYQDHRPRPSIVVDEQRPAIILLSARTGDQLLEQVRLLLGELAEQSFAEADLPALAFTLQVAREAMEHRVGWPVSSLAQLEQRLRHFIDTAGVQAQGWSKAGAQAPDFDLTHIEPAGPQGLLEAWLAGASPDWLQLYPQGTPAPLGLPGYPFARERYWHEPAPQATPATPGDQGLHPLLHRNVSDLRGLRYLTRYAGDERVLTEHQVNGQGVLAGAAMIVMIQAALTDALGGALPAGHGLVIRNLAWHQPFSVDSTRQGELFLELAAQAEGQYRVGIYSYDHAAQLQLHCQALAGTGAIEPARLDFNHLDAQSVDVQACYRRFAAMGIDYGEDHRRLLSVVRREDQALARIALQDPMLNAGFAVHPALLDAAMQGVMALLLDELGERPALLLPDGLGECVLLGDCPSTLQVQIRRLDTTAHGYRFDLALFDDNGQCRVLLNQLSFKRAAAPGATGGLLCRKQWQDTPPGSASAVPGLARRVLLLGRHPAFAELAESLSAQGIDCLALPETDYQQAALALAEQLKPVLRSAQPCLVQLLMAADAPQGYRGLAGLLYSASREQPALVSQLIEVAAELDAPQLLKALAAETADPGERQLRYLAGAGTLRRQQLDWHPGPLGSGPAPWRAQGVYLISGGLGGVGTVMARAILAAAPQARVVLCGRSPATASSVLDKLAALGAGADYRTVDLADADEVERLVADLLARYGALHGIIHCAGITRDALLVAKPAEDFSAVMAAKVQGVQHLDRCSADLALDFFVMYSSIASVLGNAGQTDYAAANGYLDAFASLRNQQVRAGTRQGRTLAINWPLWLEGGLHMSDTARRLLAQRTGIEAMASATGVQAFYQALLGDEEQLMVLAGDSERLRAWLSRQAQPQPADEAGPGDAEPLLDGLRQLLARTVKIAPSRLDDQVPFEQYGIDSLMIMEMTATLEKRFGALSRTLFFEYPSLQELAGYLATRQERKAPQTPLLMQLRSLFASVLRTPAEQIDEHRCFEDLGVDSLQILELTRRLEADFGPLAPALLFEHSSLQALAACLAARAGGAPVQPASAAGDAPRRLFEGSAQPRLPAVARRDDIAIIGIAGRYPDADDLDAFWENLSQGRNSISQIPPERWDWRDYYSSDRSQEGVHNSKWGGFIDGIDQFDPLFFNISPLEAELLDPQERLFLQTAWAAMEDAGYSRQLGAGLVGDALQVGVYAGVMYNEYQLLGAEASLRGRRMGFAGSSASIANRVSFCLNLQGPSLAVDSMCSSSLTALHLACQDLHSGRTAMAIAGGVNLTLHPNKYLMLSSGQFISSQGQCASFGEGGDGYVPGEGVGVVVLKRLADAERDGDQIHGLIKGSYLNHGGKSTGYSVPDPRAQQAAISGALKDANLDPAAISYIEAHGTGTRLGDPIEIAGLANALSQRPPGQTCWIGSVKSNIGHCEAAAGIAGLTKLLLQLKHRQIVPSLHSRTLNPFIDFAASSFEVNQQLREWPQPVRDGQPMPRMAGLSSFGAGGANAHLIVAQYDSPPVLAGPDGQPQMILLSAREPEQLAQIASRLLARLEQARATDSLADIAWTLQVGREAMEHRAAFIASSLASLLPALGRLAGGDRSGWICGDASSPGELVEQFKQRCRNQWNEPLAKLLAEGEQRQVLELWSAGLRVDWAALRAGRGTRPRRISLPAYPFATDRYWAPRGGSDWRVSSCLHPLLHHNCSTFDRQRFTSLLHGHEPWLLDHRVDGRKTLPGAAYLEMIRAAVMHSREVGEAQGMVIEQLHWLAPLTVASTARRLRVDLQRREGQLAVTVLSDDSDEPLVHCQARITDAVPAATERLDLAHWRRQPWTRRLDSAEVYRLFAQMGLDYGASHRGIQQLWVAEQGGQRQVLAQLDLAGIHPGGDQWLEPGLTDSALQAAIGLVLPLAGEPAEPLPLLLPFALQRLEILAPCQRRMWALLRGGPDATAGRVEIELADDQGQLCARFAGLSARALGAAVKTPQALPTRQLLTPLWSVAAAAPGEYQDIPGARLVFGVTECRRPLLAELYPQAVLVGDTQLDYSAQLQAHPELQQVLWLAPADDASADLVGAQQHGVLALFRLVKALLEQGHGRRELVLTLVTAQAIAVHPGESCSVAHASVHGLAGSLAKEYPHWRVQLVDLADPQLPRLAAAPFTAVASGELLAWRQGQWWFRQLARVQADAPPPRLPVYRDGGVYLVIGGAGGIGAVWSQHVISRHRARVVWIGRRPLDAQIAAKLDELTAISVQQGAPAPVYLQVDATDAQQLAAAKRQVIERFGAIHGVVHSAIVLKDQSLANMDEQTFSQVLEAKVATSAALASTFADSAEGLDFVLFFSSMMTFSTAAGQGNYAAGCTFADAFADQLRRQWACPVKVINWGYWGGVGTVSDGPYRARMAALGLGSIEPEDGLAVLDQLLAGELDQLALLTLLPQVQLEAIAGLPGLLGHEQVRLSAHPQACTTALQERLQQRLAALAAIT